MKDTHTVPADFLKGQTERRGWENKIKERDNNAENKRQEPHATG